MKLIFVILFISISVFLIASEEELTYNGFALDFAVDNLTELFEPINNTLLNIRYLFLNSNVRSYRLRKLCRKTNVPIYGKW